MFVFRWLITLAFVAICALGSARTAFALATADPVDCWVENLTPSTQVGAWAQYVVHMSGGFGSYSVTLSYGDGHADQGSYSAYTASFSHLFWTPGTYTQTATVSGAGSQATCGTTTVVY